MGRSWRLGLMFHVKHLVGLSSMVERRTLTPLILVRVKEPEPMFHVKHLDNGLG